MNFLKKVGKWIWFILEYPFEKANSLYLVDGHDDMRSAFKLGLRRVFWHGLCVIMVLGYFMLFLFFLCPLVTFMSWPKMIGVTGYYVAALIHLVWALFIIMLFGSKK